ncbi:hypothetical protein V8G54_035243 [Vigna mungo]|uniref:Early nodulin-93 n=1 Tax=Vigna mungo TaxID=3915 RepID=A0AAQ3MG67_VIGMU
MGIPSELRDIFLPNKRDVFIASPAEDRRVLRTKQCTDEGVHAGFRAACIACVASAVPTVQLLPHNNYVLSSTGLLTAVRVIPWAKANLNYTAQALIISAASIAAYFITADKTILECARKNALLEDALNPSLFYTQQDYCKGSFEIATHCGFRSKNFKLCC